MKNQELVLRMSLAERVKLVTSASVGENSSVGSYAFPQFRLSPNPAAETEGRLATLFPSDKALACTWNPSLVKDVYKCIGNEAKAHVPNAYFNVSNALTKEGVSDDYYFTGSFLAHKALGLNLSGACVNFENAPETEDETLLHESVKQITDFILRESEPDSVTLKTTEEAEKFPEDYEFGGLIYGVASSAEEAIRYLYLGCSLVFLKEDFTEELISRISDLTAAYEKAERDHNAGKISLSEFDRRQRNLEILDGALIDAACDRLVSIMLALKANNPASIRETPSSLQPPRSAKFNEKFHDIIAYRAAQQSAVLLKNRNNALPLNKTVKLAVIGEYAENPVYQTELTENNPTAVRLPFKEINDYPLNAIGFARGYLKGANGRVDLVETACRLCADAEYALVYLSAERGATALPAGQTELLDALAGRGVKIIAVVSSDGAIDFSFAEKCEAVLYTCQGGQAVTGAVLDILTGRVCPSGKLTEKMQGYPFGFGLSYTHFEYKNLKITENGISCTVVNRGGCDGFATVQMYVQKQGSESTLSEKQLRGFSKVFVTTNDAVKVEIPFDGNTFRAYDARKKRFCVEGGDYRIFIAENAEAVKLEGEITLSEFIYKHAVYENEAVERDESAPVGFTDSKKEAAIRKEKKGLSFGLKLFLAIVLMIYYNAVGAVLVLTNVIAEKTLAFYITVGVLLLIGDVLAVIYIVYISKKRKLQRYLHPNEVLSDMVDKVSEFDEIAKISYAQPVPQTNGELNEEEEPVSAEELPSEAYEAAFEEKEEESVFVKEVAFAELCTNFRAYAWSKGVAVEPSSVRALFAALSSAKLVFLGCKNREILPELLRAVCGYFGAETVAAENLQSQSDLLWRREGEKFVTSEFANAVYAAGKSPGKTCVVILSGVNPQNLRDYFDSFIDYALTPSEEHTVSLGELTLRLPDNLCYLLVPESEEDLEVSAELAHASLQIEIIASGAEASEKEVEIKTVSRTALSGLVSEARENRFLSEKIWKKIDSLAEAIGATERFEIGNKNILQLEKFTAVLMDCGGDESEAATALFTAKLVPLLKLLKTYRAENGDKTVYGIIEKLFGEEDLSKIRKLLVRIS